MKYFFLFIKYEYHKQLIIIPNDIPTYIRIYLRCFYLKENNHQITNFTKSITCRSFFLAFSKLVIHLFYMYILVLSTRSKLHNICGHTGKWKMENDR